MNISPRLQGEQCTATSKTTGERCQRRTVGGGPCRYHGGAAPQVAAAREARIVTLQANAAATPVIVRNPAAALLGAARDADEVVQRLKATIAARGQLDAASLEAFGAWLDRVSRLSKAVLDSGAEKHQAALTEQQGEQLAQVIRGSLDTHLTRVLGVLGNSAAADTIRRAWPTWMSEIVPAQIAAATGARDE